MTYVNVLFTRKVFNQFVSEYRKHSKLFSCPVPNHQQRLGNEMGIWYRDNGRQGGCMPLKPTAEDKYGHGKSYESKQQGQLHRRHRGDHWPVGRSIGGRSGRKVEKKGDKSSWCVPSNLLRHGLRQHKTSYPRYNTIEAIQGSGNLLDVGLIGMQPTYSFQRIVHQ